MCSVKLHSTQFNTCYHSNDNVSVIIVCDNWTLAHCLIFLRFFLSCCIYIYAGFFAYFSVYHKLVNKDLYISYGASLSNIYSPEGEYWKYSRGKRTVLTRSAIIPPKVNRWGWNLEQCAPNVGGWSWQILGAIRAVATVWEGAEFLCFFCHANNARFHRFPVGQILRHLNTTTSIGVVM